MKPQKGLGRGLDAIFSNEKIESAKSTASSSTSSATMEIPLKYISPNPTQPRREFGDEELHDLARSIAEMGVIQPITVRSMGGNSYVIVSGERRWRAAQIAKTEAIPAYIREVDDEQMQMMALVENILREDLNPLEIALALQRLLDECGATQEALSKRLTMSRSSISNYLRLLRLSDEVQFALKGGLISMGHAKAIASVEGAELQLKLLKMCVEDGISVRQAELFAQNCNSEECDKPQQKRDRVAVPKGFESLSKHLMGIFPKGVSFKGNSRGGGKIVINYSNQNELKQLIKELDINE